MELFVQENLNMHKIKHLTEQIYKDKQSGHEYSRAKQAEHICTVLAQCHTLGKTMINWSMFIENLQNL